MVGSCRIIFGPMFANKSTTLRQEITTLADIGLKVIYINHRDDVRNTEAKDSKITTHHSGFKGLSNKVKAIKVKSLSKVNVEKYDAIGIDEGQFFDDLDVIVRKWVLEKDKIVIIASLDSDYMLNPFGKAHNLICLCEPGNIVKLSAFCFKCMEKSLKNGRIDRIAAGFTAKLSIEKEVLEGKVNKQKEVGSSDKYIPVCMKCYNKHMIYTKQRSKISNISEEPIIPSIDLDIISLENIKLSTLS